MVSFCDLVKLRMRLFKGWAMSFSKKVAVSVFTVSTFLTPIHIVQAQEKACVAVTEVSSDGQIIWSKSPDISELVEDAQKLEISPADYKELCGGEEVTEEASDKKPEEDKEKTEEVAAEETTAEEKVDLEKTASAAESSGIGWGGAVLGGLAAAAAGGGGGGSGGSTSTFLDETTTFTYDANLDATWVARQEYINARYGSGAGTIHPYTTVGVNNAYARGLSGSGKVVAVYDSAYHLGNHKEFAVKKAAGNITNDGTLTTTASWGWHGQHVAGTIGGEYNNNNANHLAGAFGDSRDYGMMGVAYNSKLHLSDINDTSVYTNSIQRATAAVNAARIKGAIAQNNSWSLGACSNAGGCTTTDEYVTYQNNNGTTDSQTLAATHGGSASDWADAISAYDNFQNSGIVVFANGNDVNSANSAAISGLPVIATELADAWLTVGNLNITGNTVSAGTVTRIGNACGVAAEFCIFADGTHIWSSTGDNNNAVVTNYDTFSGSSMAAPIVSGSIALLSEAFPNHTPGQLQDRILASANNDFFTATGTTSFINGITHGYNAEFGHGILDLATALGPISTSSMIPAASRTGLLNGRYGNIQTARRFTLSSSQVRLGAAFGDSLSNALNGKKAYFYDALNGGFAFNIGSLVKNHPIATSKIHSFNNIISGNMLIARKTDNGVSFMSDTSHNSINESGLMTFVPLSKTSSFFVGKNIHIQNAMSFTQRSETPTKSVKKGDPFNIPFLQASEKGTSAGNKTKLGKGTLSFGVFDGKSFDYSMKTSGFVSEYGLDMGSTYSALFTGVTIENDGFLETSVEGAFAEDAKSNTTFAGISSYGWLNNNWSYNALGSIGSTKMDVGGIGLMSSIENVTSSSLAFEVSRPVGLFKKDSLHIGISQPLRVESGNASIMVPQLYEINGNMRFDTVSVDLAPSGRQIDIGAGYQATVYGGVDVTVQTSVSKDYGHMKSNNLVKSFAGFIKVKF